jgi:hypothetical protein
MASGLFFVSLANIYRNHARRSAWIFLGLTLGLLIIIKPVWFVILPFAIPVLIFAQWQRWLTPKDASINGFIFIGCATLIFMPFIIRNGITMDVWRLANPTYLGQALAHRLAFNDMSWLEWAIGWLYYLPDFGDNLSADLFGKTAIAKLGWSPESYYVHGRDILYYQALEATPQGDASAWLLQNYFFNDVIKTTAVGLLLSWRGIFVGDMVGFVSVCLSIPALLIMPKQRLSICLLMLLPIAVVVGANGMASVSIPRYNLPLVILYTITIAQVLSWVAARTVPLLPTRLHGLMAIALPKNI